MIYQTVDLRYLKVVNSEVYEHAWQFNIPPAHWSFGRIRNSETRAGNWEVVRDGKLTIPLENWLESMERRTAKLWG
ncbi:MAG: hypothetical protein CMB11_07595 [Euryarchaeota archaeon]|nr:hypothetical protein [Euryarchaeota archaeon]|tara:strand:- start:4972 stop:5199 length:228 start_codon:yes stop_codon:yes gene_type:complete